MNLTNRKALSKLRILLILNTWQLIVTAVSHPTYMYAQVKEGSLVRNAVTGTVYIIESGRKRGIPDPVTFAALGFVWGQEQNLDPSVIDSIPSGANFPSLTNSLVRNPKTGTIYLMVEGKRRGIPDLQTFASLGFIGVKR